MSGYGVTQDFALYERESAIRPGQPGESVDPSRSYLDALCPLSNKTSAPHEEPSTHVTERRDLAREALRMDLFRFGKR